MNLKPIEIPSGDILIVCVECGTPLSCYIGTLKDVSCDISDHPDVVVVKVDRCECADNQDDDYDNVNDMGV